MLISIYNVSNVFFICVVLYSKSVEDYIASFSQHNTTKIVSIYQSRIDKDGQLDSGIAQGFINQSFFNEEQGTNQSYSSNSSSDKN